MADIDLKDALQMFQGGVRDLMFSRSLSSANDQVQQIKASEANEQEQRAQIQQVANGLTMHMAQLGTPATTMQAVNTAISGPRFNNANEMMANAVQTGNTGLMKEATDLRDFTDNTKFELQKMKLAAKLQAANDPVRQAQLQSIDNERFTKHTTEINNKIDTNTSRINNISKLQGVNNQIQDAMALVSDPSKWTPQGMNETVRKLDNVLSGGASTVSGTEHLTPKIRAQYEANLQQLITNKPTPMAGADEFRKYYADVFTRVKDINANIIQEGQLQYVRGELPALLHQFPKRTAEIERSLSNKIGEPVVIDPKTQDIDLQRNVDTQDQYAEAIRKAAQNPKDPRVKEVMGVISSDDRNLRRTLLRYPDIRKLYGKVK